MRDSLIAIHRAIEFIEAHLHEEISVADMALAAGYSLFHFVRVFNKIVQHTPYDYLMRRRLSNAAQALVNSNRKIIDIALDHCFHSPEVFSRAFKRMFGMQPSQYRVENVVDSRFLLSQKSLKFLRHINHEKFFRPVLQQQAVMTLVGLMTRVPDYRQGIQQIWDSLGGEIPNLSEFPCFGVVTYPKDWFENGKFYMAGVVQETPDHDRHSLVTRIIPGGEYATFKHVGSSENMALTREYAYQTWLPKSGRKLANPLEIEYYGIGMEIESTGFNLLIQIR